MLKSLAAAVIATVSFAELPSPSERALVQAMDDAMKVYGRDQHYEIYRTTTTDGFLLTLYRLLPKVQPAPAKKGTILF